MPVMWLLRPSMAAAAILTVAALLQFSCRRHHPLLMLTLELALTLALALAFGRGNVAYRPCPSSDGGCWTCC